MGVDIVGIIKHKLSKKEIIELPRVIDAWHDVKSFVEDYRKDNEEFTRNEPLRNTKWEDKIDEDLLEKVWVYREGRGRIQFPIYLMTNCLNCFFGSLMINRHTMHISLWPEHKYANVQDPVVARYMFELNRKIAARFGQSEILYCADSAFYAPEEIHSESYAGLSFEELIEFATQNFGPVPIISNEGMKNLFFLDKVGFEMEALKPWDWSEVEWP